MIHPCTAVAFDGGAKKAERPHLVHDFAVKSFMAIRHEHPGQQFFLAVGMRGIADHALFIGQLVVEKEGVVPFEDGF